ncbi:MAG: archease [Bryobacteraceae bacterium]
MFEILEHTADIGFRARGQTREELFENAALALESIAVETGQIESRDAYPIAASGEDDESLLVNWLSEVLYYLDGRRVVMRHFQIEQNERFQVRGKALGEARDAERHAAKLVVKGVTYHQLKITHDDKGWCAEVYLDV